MTLVTDSVFWYGFCLSVYLPVCLSSYLSARVSACRPFCLSVCLFACVSAHPVFLLVCLAMIRAH